ncbi:hypothetical protein METBIDRAFT_36097 [Metschnikowia bicuspidata var. bicuspidata NRRL YB-4993]|uniref:50S ribosomal protein L35 n=1 Tax=Metschnikowia bicuspidata var. bicuspidata NRRL YB-4993 TaxID=869754 RepID=A0A1A0HIB2_9ASCO|nr:hypothetical protein METBIDRAFT_36097 [Metschnikowia bicuspidata var. bicuspidata NRRL YB-4993]OBA23578.1 hypothetical protein METBIDRAFT_36097 [Metschnikowia bicuspidata var. bicuspidata NRRL YB-4993]
MNQFLSTANKVIFGQRPAVSLLIQTRNKTKTCKAMAKRFIKTGSGYKRKQAGRNHGNGNFSAHSIRHLDSYVAVTNKGLHLKKLKKAMGF